MTDEEIKAAMVDELGGWPVGSGYYQYTVTTDDAREMVDALLPVVHRIAEQRAAEELRAVADAIFVNTDDRVRIVTHIRARAAALNPS